MKNEMTLTCAIDELYGDEIELSEREILALRFAF